MIRTQRGTVVILPALHSSASSSLCDFYTKSHWHSRTYKRCCRDRAKREIEGTDNRVFVGLEPHLTVIDVSFPTSLSVSVSFWTLCCVYLWMYMCICYAAFSSITWDERVKEDDGSRRWSGQVESLWQKGERQLSDLLLRLFSAV